MAVMLDGDIEQNIDRCRIDLKRLDEIKNEGHLSENLARYAMCLVGIEFWANNAINSIRSYNRFDDKIHGMRDCLRYVTGLWTDEIYQEPEALKDLSEDYYELFMYAFERTGQEYQKVKQELEEN